jgi:hypothetical protein
MASAAIQLPSDAWIPSVINMCFAFLKVISKHPGGQYLVFRDRLLGTVERPGKITNEYHKTASLLKEAIYRDKADTEKIDHHKIAALYIRAFLKYKPFSLEIPNETKFYKTCKYTELANEYFLIDYLEAVFQAANEDFNGILQMNDNYKEDFIKLLYKYRNDLSSLDPLSLANMICLIEEKYFISSKLYKRKK